MPYGIDGKDVDEVSFFGRLFEFNCDGETDFFDELLGLGMIPAVTGAAEEEEQLLRELDEELEEEEDEEMERAIRATLAEMSSFYADDYEEESESVIRAKLAGNTRYSFLIDSDSRISTAEIHICCYCLKKPQSPRGGVTAVSVCGGFGIWIWVSL